MQYISPVSLLQTLVPGPADKKSYALAKKKLLAELELNGGDTITINSHALTKNDIIALFDALQQEDNLAYHTAVADDAVLLRFLEHNIIDKGDRFNDDELYEDPRFIDWISPYFITSFNSFVDECLVGRHESIEITQPGNAGFEAAYGAPTNEYFEEAPETGRPLFVEESLDDKSEYIGMAPSTDPLIVQGYTPIVPAQKDYGGWMALFANPVLLNPVFKEEAWTGIESKVRKDLAQLYDFYNACNNKTNRESGETEEFDDTPGVGDFVAIEALVDPHYVTMLRLLPHERFGALQDEYGYTIMQCAVHVFNNGNREESAAMMEDARTLAVTPEIQGAIRMKQREMEELATRSYSGNQGNTGYDYPRTNSRSRSRGKSGISSWGFRLAFFAIYFIFRLSTCDSNTDRSYLQNAPVFVLDRAQIDSLQAGFKQAHVGDTIPVSTPAMQTMPPSLLSHPAKNSSQLDSILKKYKLKDTTAP